MISEAAIGHPHRNRYALVRLLALAATVVALSRSAAAHEVRPAYLELREEARDEFHVLWKTPEFGGQRLAVDPEFSDPTNESVDVTVRTASDAVIQTWKLRVPALRGQTVTMRGLESTITDALVRIEFLDGTTWVKRLTPQEPSAAIPFQQRWWQLAGEYIRLGYEHILLGVDHLLFVLGLMLIVRGNLALLKTITAFTIAHSMTLAVATLGVAHAPAPPLNAGIALSILFLGPEIVRVWRCENSLTIRRPWIVAFVFGLLHGFGFASGLVTTGMPGSAIPQALLWFNVGVELGQVTFVALLLAVLHSWRVLEMRWPVWIARAPGYAVGVCGAFWTIQRTVIMLTGR